jgi:hypothetical protein|nr:MAG TPA: hypothetical protein [Caudoviricetes sp.]
MSTNISKQKREDLLNKIKEIRNYIATAPFLVLSISLDTFYSNKNYAARKI